MQRTTDIKPSSLQILCRALSLPHPTLASHLGSSELGNLVTRLSKLRSREPSSLSKGHHLGPGTPRAP